MLTDDDLTTELRAAFRAETDTLSYDGRRRPRRVPSPVIPLTAAALTVGAVAVAVGVSGQQAPPAATPPVSPTPTVSASTAPSSARMVTEDVSLAGYIIRVQHPAGQKFEVRANFRDEVPAGLRMITLSQPPGKAWVGTDPVTGDPALFVRVPITDNGHRVFAILAKGASEDLLVDLMNGPPTPVPLTKD